MTEPAPDAPTLPNACRPTIFGYIHTHSLMTDAVLALLQVELTGAARREGYTLGRVYVEEPAHSPAAFQSLMEALRNNDANAVIVPSMSHLTALGTPASMKQHLEYEGGARVLVIDALRGP